MRKWLPVVPILIGAGASAIMYGRLPADVRPDWSIILPMVHDSDVMPRVVVAWLMPAVAALVWAALAWGARVRGTDDGAYLSNRTDASAIARFEPTFEIVVTAVVGLIILLHLAILGSVAGWPAWTARLLACVLGLGIAATGNLIPRTRPNWIVGIRTRATLNDPALWLRTHRYFGGLLMLFGLAVAVIGLFASKYAFVAGIASILVAGVLAHFFARSRPGAAVMVAALGTAHWFVR